MVTDASGDAIVVKDMANVVLYDAKGTKRESATYNVDDIVCINGILVARNAGSGGTVIPPKA
ncbi:hypothetical protein JD292_02510 [Leucobacter sp. CSA2]|uniref:Uncharacterized protein n=1 Tax=Leucobacter edaphi TaxID=2796472 RepID=A0A934QD25_9MICO|nr:hypothetical protein [Leucobacter edaphi]MBK0420954.1 hypothetical protein [Leucobacter edaphi]